MKHTILITGGAGFIGSTLADKLLAKGTKIVSIDNFDRFYDKAIKESNFAQAREYQNFHFEKGDIRDNDFVSGVFNKYHIDTIVHLAAKAGVRPSIANPVEYFDVNVQGTLTLLDNARKSKIKKIVFASSSSVYGNNEKIPYSETDNVDFPISPYAGSKKSGELLTHIYHSLYDINVINLRFFTVYGPRQRPDLAIHKFFKCIYNQTPIDVYGDGSTSRDYTYVDDIVSGVISAIDYIQNDSKIYETINLGNNSPVKLHELISEIEKVTGKTFQINRMPMQPGDVNITFADINKAKSLLGYNPGTSLNDGLRKFDQWFQQTQALLKV